MVYVVISVNFIRRVGDITTDTYFKTSPQNERQTEKNLVTQDLLLMKAFIGLGNIMM